MRNRPFGLKYKKHKENPTSFKKGMIPWNKEVKGTKVWNTGLTKETDNRKEVGVKAGNFHPT